MKIQKIVSILLVSVFSLSYPISQAQSKPKINVDKKEDLNKKLYDAIDTENLSEVKKLITTGVKVNQKRGISEEILGVTPLMFASYRDNVEIVKFLISKGADINAKITEGDLIGYTPLIFGSTKNSKEVIETLLSKGANINDKDGNGWNAL
ncbi:MAG: ankyrin repeat domain-containing protein, partial [Candidatus Sericytochromatia bacterium]